MRYSISANDDVAFHFDKFAQFDLPTLLWYPSDEELRFHMTSQAASNPASGLWREPMTEFPSDSLLSGHTDFSIHPGEDLKRAIKLRKENMCRHDHRGVWLKLRDSDGSLRKIQLMERVSYDNQILVMREEHPAPSIDASEASWKNFVSDEHHRLISSGITPQITQGSALPNAKRKRPDGHTTGPLQN